MKKPPHWGEFEQRTQPAQKNEEYGEICAMALTSPAGQRLMTFLNNSYVRAVLPGHPSAQELIELNAKRQLVRELEEQTERGLAALARDKDK